MGQFSASSATTTDFTTNIDNFSVNSQIPDQANPYGAGYTWWDYPNTSKYLGYYKQIPELKSAIKVLCMRIVGQGYTTDEKTKRILENLKGNGKDNFSQIMSNLLTQKKIFGDAFAEIVRNENGYLINLKPLYTGNMRTVFKASGGIEKYEQKIPAKEPLTFKPYEIFHLQNDRIANEIHGISIIEVLQNIIDAKNEALADERRIKHLQTILGIVEVDSGDPTEFSNVGTQMTNAAKNTDFLMIPKDLAKFAQIPPNPTDRIPWLNYLDNLFYQIVGIPKVLVTSEGYTEAGGKAGLLAFEPNEIAEKQELEKDLWNQLAIKITFARAPSLTQSLQNTEAANTGQLGFQPNDLQVKPNRQ